MMCGLPSMGGRGRQGGPVLRRPCRPFCRPMPPLAAVLEHPPHTRLQLPRVAEPRADRAVEVLVRRARRGIPEVVGVGDVEDLDQSLELSPRASREWPRDADVLGEVRVVLADGIPQEDVPIGADPVLWASRPAPTWLVANALLGRRLS